MTLFISSDEKIEIERFSCNKDLNRYEEVRIFFRNMEREYILYANDFLCEAIETFQRLLSKAINRKLELDSSIIEKGIGFISNENFQNKPGLKMVKEKEGYYWIGDKYLIWDSMNYQTWIYNLNNDIVIEITPTYQWHFEDFIDGKNEYISYEEFKENYKTCVVRKISKNMVKNWLDKCNNILDKLS
ncbi:hypothetical protein KHQ81_06075 [Mycoplasmatota bacterium]|nr:hypothetical protein KHQ81_06075 [Mycoplasmatota bacterium]